VTPTVVQASFEVWGSTATLVLAGCDGSLLAEGLGILKEHLDRFDAAVNRFRPDSELSLLNRRPSAAVQVSETFSLVLSETLRLHALTGGLVDPTVGAAVEACGYDRDFASLDRFGPAPRAEPSPSPGLSAITFEPSLRQVCLEEGVRLDFGGTAKAMCADLSARAVARATGVACLVSLGGDVAVSGPCPWGGWPVRVALDHRQPLEAPGPVVEIHSGGLATSSSALRSWTRGGSRFHHIIDPRCGLPARTPWAAVSVAAGTCLDANGASLAAMILAERAPSWLDEHRLPARMVDGHGEVVVVGDWPPDAPEGAPPCLS